MIRVVAKLLGLLFSSTVMAAATDSPCEWNALSLQKFHLPQARSPLRYVRDAARATPILAFENGAGLRDRTIEIPANVLDRSRDTDHDTLLIVVAHNTFMDGGYHNLGASAAEHLLRQLDPHRFEFAPHRTWTEITYDDESARSGNLDFYSLNGKERTVSGEFIEVTVPGSHGPKKAYIVKAIGDYNEVGDFAVPIARVLRLPTANIVVLRDDLNSDPGTVALNRAKPTAGVKHEGNNMLRSMNRNLLMGFSETMRDTIIDSPLLAGALPIEHASMIAFFNKLEEAIHKRQGGLSNAGAVETYLEEHFWNGAVESFFPGRARLIKNGKKSAADLDALYDQRPLEAAFATLKTALKAQLQTRLGYSQILLGTKAPAGITSLHDYVLSPYPESIYNREFFDQVTATLQQLYE